MILSYELTMSVYPHNKLGLFLLETVLYPGEQKNLHVFEPRYKEMVAECMAKDKPFVIVRGDDRQIKEVGCTAMIKKVLAQYADGQVDIQVEGGHRVQLIRIDRTRSYQQGIVEEYHDTTETVPVLKKEQLIAQHIKLLEIAGRTVDPQYYRAEGASSWLIGRNCGLSVDQRQTLLEMQCEGERVEFLTEYLAELIPKVIEKWEIRQRIKSNGHFKDFPPG